MIQIYHNNRCRKSREGLQTVQASELPYEIIDYISNPLDAKELEKIITILDIAPIDLVRKNEALHSHDCRLRTMRLSEIAFKDLRIYGIY